MSEKMETEEVEHAARLFDIRRIIGGLFCLYGIIIAIVGLFDSDAEIAKAEGVNINLWTGIAMFVVGAVFFVWQWLRPIKAPEH